MNDVLVRCYRLLVDDEPKQNMKNWEIAFWIVQHWDGRKLEKDEELAKLCLCKIIVEVAFDSRKIQEIVVDKAEQLASEMFPQLGHREVNSDMMARVLHRYYETGKFD